MHVSTHPSTISTPIYNGTVQHDCTSKSLSGDWDLSIGFVHTPSICKQEADYMHI